MKKSCKALYRLSLLFFAISIYSCQKDIVVKDSYLDKSKGRFFESVNLDDAPSVRKYLKTSLSKKLRSRNQEDGIFVFASDIIKRATKKGVAYTFKAQKQNQPEGSFSNLIVVLENDKIVESFVLDYYPEEEAWLSSSDNVDHQPYQGRVELEYLDSQLEDFDFLRGNSGGGGGPGWNCDYVTQAVCFYGGSRHTPGIQCWIEGNAEFRRTSVCTYYISNPDGEGDSPLGSGSKIWTSNPDAPSNYNGGSPSPKPKPNTPKPPKEDDKKDDPVTTPNPPSPCQKNRSKIALRGGGGGGIILVNDECDDNDTEETDCNTKKEDLKKVFTTTSDAKLTALVNHINTYGKDFGINTKEDLRHFLAQAAHESGKFTAFEENLNYRWKKLGKKGYWKTYFNTIENPTADKNKKNPNDFKRSNTSNFVKKKEFANWVYGSEKRSGTTYDLGNGNEASGDGYKYRGRGIFQLTGKSNYQEFNNFYKDKYDKNADFIANPDQIATDMKIAVISALWFYNNQVNTGGFNIDANTTVKQVTKKVNGKYNGLEDRKAIFKKLKDKNIDCVTN